ncbi:vesicular acetylcholine transporter-like [Amphiura filiformis]|uniref:vesicular acetylcholine transporter-like n=1 Tax=Amphiura filiformis TaxID=82378 RepID=UPI003B220F82
MISPILSQWDWVHSTGVHNEEKNHFVNYSTANESFTNTLSSSSSIYYTGVAIFVILPTASIACTPLSGYLGDQVGYEIALLTGLLLSSGMSICFAFSTNFLGVFVARLLQGAASSFCTPNAFATITHECPQNTKLGKIVLAFAVATNCFSYIGAAVFGVAFEVLGPKLAFLVLLLPMCVTLLLLTFIIILTTSNCSGESIPPITHHEEVTDETRHAENGSSFADILRDFQIIFVSGGGTVALLPKKCLDITLAIWMNDCFNSGPATVGTVISIAGVAALLGNICATKLSMLLFPQFTYILYSINLSVGAIPIILLPFSPNPYFVAVCYFFSMFFASITRYWIVQIPSDIVDQKYPSSRGRVMNVVTVFMSLPNIIGPFLAVIIFNAMGFRYVCITVGCLCISYSFLFVFTPYANYVKYSELK